MNRGISGSTLVLLLVRMIIGVTKKQALRTVLLNKKVIIQIVRRTKNGQIRPLSLDCHT